MNNIGNYNEYLKMKKSLNCLEGNYKTTWLQDLIFSKFKEALSRLKENHFKKQYKENCPYCNE